MASVARSTLALVAATLPLLAITPSRNADAAPWTWTWPSASALPTPGAVTLPPLPSFLPTGFALPTPPAVPPLPTAVPTTMPTTLPTAKGTGPFTKGADFVLKPRTNTPKRTLLASSMPYARYAPDGETLLLGGASVKVITKSNASGVPLPGTRAYRSAFSPDSKRVVTTDEDGKLVVWSLPSGAVLRKIDNAVKQFGTLGTNKYWAAEVGFPDANTVYVHDGCRLKKLDLANATSTLVSIGASDFCGRVRVSDDGKRWVVSQEGTKAYGEGLWYVRSALVDSTTGVAKTFVDEAKVGAYTDVQLSPKGDRLCFERTSLKLSCVGVDDGKVDDVSDAKVDRWFDYDATGEHLLFADRYTPGVAVRGLYWVDFAARTVRRITQMPSAMQRWGFFGGGRRVGIDGESAGCIAFDLDAAWSMMVMGPKEGAEGFFAVPNNPKRAIAGRAVGPSRDLYWIDFPD